ncbi:MAG: pyridoxal-phosphate dependent enzyme [Chloroflexota bacterium]|nr:pyridoxal-phosphate dependent enzyme [Chloroflexota bacterium]
MSAPEPLQPTSLPDAVNGWTSLRDAARVGIWRHRPALGLPAGIPEISLGEGDTPIVPLQRWGSAHGLPRVLAKLEYVSPTGSFKDRGAAAVIAVLAWAGVDAIVEDSSGNAGAAMAAYAARAGLRARIFVPESAPAAKRDQIAGYGAQVVAVAGTREDVATAAEHAAHAPGVAYASHARHPAFVEGTKTFGLEIAAALADDPPLHIVLPVGNGGLLLGAFKAYGELAASGHRVSLPRLHAAQTTACAPLAAAFAAGAEAPLSVQAQPTVAGGVAVGRPARGVEVLAAIRASGGSAVQIDDGTARRTRAELSRLEGLDLEYTSAVGFAAASQLRTSGVIGSNDRVLIAATGIGLKDAGV